MLNSYVISVTICFTFPSIITSRQCDQTNNNANVERDQRLNLKEPVKDQSSPPLIEKPRNRCCPYDFDSKICKVIDDRVLCGFNRNIGRPQSKDNALSHGKNCRLRGGRLECGYQNGPFTNPRRPPPWNNPETDVDDDNDDNDINIGPNRPQPNGKESQVNDKGSSSEAQDDQHVQKLKKTNVTPGHPNKGVTRCVEIRERIVCRDM